MIFRVYVSNRAWTDTQGTKLNECFFFRFWYDFWNLLCQCVWLKQRTQQKIKERERERMCSCIKKTKFGSYYHYYYYAFTKKKERKSCCCCCAMLFLGFCVSLLYICVCVYSSDKKKQSNALLLERAREIEKKRKIIHFRQ